MYFKVFWSPTPALRAYQVEIKSFAAPPTPVMLVCMCVVILRPLGREDLAAGWAGAKAMLADAGLLRALQEHDQPPRNPATVS